MPRVITIGKWRFDRPSNGIIHGAYNNSVSTYQISIKIISCLQETSKLHVWFESKSIQKPTENQQRQRAYFHPLFARSWFRCTFCPPFVTVLSLHFKKTCDTSVHTSWSNHLEVVSVFLRQLHLHWALGSTGSAKAETTSTVSHHEFMVDSEARGDHIQHFNMVRLNSTVRMVEADRMRPIPCFLNPFLTATEVW